MTITEFLLARIAEDEEVATGGAPSPWQEGAWDGRHDGPREVLDRHGNLTAGAYYGGTYGHVLRFAPTRVLAELAVKRRVIELADEATGLDMSVDLDRRVGSRDMEKEPYCGDLILRALASVYADHPDFLEEWRA